MPDDLLEGLPLVQRLALSYAPAAARADTLTLLALDARLAEIVRRRSEVLLAQLKLAWWRDRLREDPAQWPAGEPLLARLAGWRGQLEGLGELVNGWEALLAETLAAADMRAFAAGRAAAWSALARQLGQPGSADAAMQAAREWALADLALHLGAWPDAELAREVTLAEPWRRPGLPRSLRPLAMLHGLVGRAVRRGSRDQLDAPSAGLLALRIGLLGR
jgi:phytoene synthase